MFAVVEIGGIQMQVHPNERVKTPLLAGAPGDTVEFGNILIGGEENSPNVGTPYLSGTVSAKILEHGKDKKIWIFHKKRRKGYRKLNGHRQHFSVIEVLDINFGKAKKPRAKATKAVAEDSIPQSQPEGEVHGS